MSPGPAPVWRSALKVVTPAQSNGADFDRVEIVGHMRDRGHMGDHVGRIAAVAGYPGRGRDVLAGKGGVSPAAAAIAA